MPTTTTTTPTLDARHTVALEFTGAYEPAPGLLAGQRYVARFCGDRVGAGTTRDAALDALRAFEARRHESRYAYTLVAVDYDSRGLDISVLTAKLGRAVLSVETTTSEQHRTGALMPTYRIRLDGNELRNTEAHGIGYRAGYIVNTES